MLTVAWTSKPRAKAHTNMAWYIKIWHNRTIYFTFCNSIQFNSFILTPCKAWLQYIEIWYNKYVRIPHKQNGSQKSNAYQIHNILTSSTLGIVAETAKKRSLSVGPRSSAPATLLALAAVWMVFMRLTTASIVAPRVSSFNRWTYTDQNWLLCVSFVA